MSTRPGYDLLLIVALIVAVWAGNGNNKVQPTAKRDEQKAWPASARIFFKPAISPTSARATPHIYKAAAKNQAMRFRKSFFAVSICSLGLLGRLLGEARSV